MVPLGPKHVGLQEGDVVPNHLDEGLAERRESPGCPRCHGLGHGPSHAVPARGEARTSLAVACGLLRRSARARSAGDILRHPDCSSHGSVGGAPTSAVSLLPSPHGDPSFSLCFTAEGH